MIIQVTSLYPPKLGGIQKVVRVLASTQTRLGMEVRVITSNQGADAEIPKDIFAVKRLKSFVIAGTPIMPGLLLELLRVKRYDTVHIHPSGAFMPELVWLTSKLKRFHYIAHFHTDIPRLGPAGFLLNIYKPIIFKRVLCDADIAIVFTEMQRQELHSTYGVELNKIKIVPNGVEDTYYYNDSRVMHKLPRLLFVGRLAAQKNVQHLLHSLIGISAKFETTIVGDGALDQPLQQLAKELKLKNVTFAGRADGDALLNHYKQADIFVMPSQYEGMPLALLEAMAMALPVVATNITGISEVVRDSENGILVARGDVFAFRAALLKISSDKHMFNKMSKASRQMAELYSWEKVAIKLANIYQASSHE